MTTKNEMVPNQGGELFTMRDWIDDVTCGALTDYDGFGYYSDGERMLRGVYVYPSLLQRDKIDGSWSHVMWFNR